MNEQPTIGVIAISDGEIAIFGSRSGFLGPVIQNYEPFTDEAAAIDAAKAKIAAMNLPLHPDISRPRITSMRVSYGRRRRK